MEILYQTYLKEEVPDNTIESLHEITMGTHLYQLYDGTIKLSGCKKMLWHRLPIDEEDVQVLPPEKRDFPFAPTSSDFTHTVSNGGTVSSSSGVAAVTSIDPKVEELEKKMRELAVDMRPYCSTQSQNETKGEIDNQELKNKCAAELYEQLQTNGFAYIKGTGIAPYLCKDALQATNLFLNDADESVRRSCLTKDRARRGYSPMCTENFASLIGDDGPNDLVRKFRVGPVINKDQKKIEAEKEKGLDEEVTEIEKKLSCLLRPNVWPTKDVWDEDSVAYFRTSIEAFYKESCRVSRGVVHAMCDGLLQANNENTDNIDLLRSSIDALLKSLMMSNNNEETDQIISSRDTSDTSILTLLGYQKGSRHRQHGKQIRPLVAPHTDVGVVTLLLFDQGDSAKLQRIDREAENQWIDVALPRIQNECDPVFVINIGDCLSELSHGMLPSTIHRVIPKIIHGGGKKGKKKKNMTDLTTTAITPRNCLALFVGLEPTQMLTLPSSSPTIEGAERITYEEWRKRRIAQAAKVLREKSNEKEEIKA